MNYCSLYKWTRTVKYQCCTPGSCKEGKKKTKEIATKLDETATNLSTESSRVTVLAMLSEEGGGGSSGGVPCFQKQGPTPAEKYM